MHDCNIYDDKCYCACGRQLCDEVYKHLRKKGVVPEREAKVPSPTVKFSEFRISEHKIGSISSKTLWKVRLFLDMRLLGERVRSLLEPVYVS